ncbi:SF1B family DNA helicase RecD2 [Xylocopilactobacillus apicola]|uniref:ATP-dependent RecD2 DNA helicase n=1 Tax=Xylocopilactobacillus apicola TaxID=2932184 RepID=A0AAU9D779_9LACO|nr:ATP-dependent RecD-like DNA helicase [Xylocopilactobacillus apicola]BDR58241.1 ATP-dependent RecD-like DNA helicase [Xylocopilactobacillus apicola]
MEEKQKSVTGKVKKIIFRNLKDQFFIISVNIAEISFDFGQEEIVITGTMPGLAEGLTYKFIGSLTKHPKYGQQFKAQSYEIAAEPDDPSAVVKFLVSRELPGIGEKTAQKIVDKLGVNAVDEIINNPDSLNGFRINPERKKEIREKLTEDVELNKVLLAFSRFHISQAAAIDAYNLYGLEAINILNDNPYYFLGRVPRLSFNQIDQSCKLIDLDVSESERITGALKWVASEMINRSGSTLIETERVLRNTNWVLGENSGATVNEEFVEKCLNENDEDFFSFDKDFVTTQDYSNYENEIANSINQLNHPFEENDEILNSEITEFEKKTDLQLEHYQKKAITSAFKNNLSIITGGPGTGKTTIVRAIIEIFADLHHLNLQEQESEEDSGILLTAPTGKAAKSLSDKTKFPAATIHRLLKVRDVEDRNSETDLISPDLLIIDEMSLVDTGLFAQLLRSIKTKPTVIMLGDVDQLPSVGPGQVFKDLIDSDVIPTTTLQRNFRQDLGGNIINFANLINSGEIYDSMEDNYDDLKMISAKGEEIVPALEKIVKAEIAAGTPITELQILAPMYKNKGGIFEINDSIHQLVNPQKFKINGFAVGDKVIQLENVPEKDVYNGEIGIVQRVEQLHGRRITKVLFDQEHEISYEPDELNQLTLAYAISIHKAQGSEFKTVIVTMSGRFDTMLRRNLLYTAVTRARDHLYLVGDLTTFIRAAGLPSTIRLTGLVNKLQRRLDAKVEAEEFVKHVETKVLPKVKEKPETAEKKAYVLTTENYQLIDPMIGMEQIKP